MERIFWFLVGFFLVFSIGIAYAGEAVEVGGMIHNGHSYSSDNKIDPPSYVGHGATLFYERGVDNERGFDLTYGVGIDAIRFGKRDNSSMRCSWESAVNGRVEGRIYSRHNDLFQPFIGMAFGTQVASDETTGLVAGTFGIETRLNDTWSVTTFGRVTATQTRRHDLAGIGIKYRF